MRRQTACLAAIVLSSTSPIALGTSSAHAETLAVFTKSAGNPISRATRAGAEQVAKANGFTVFHYIPTSADNPRQQAASYAADAASAELGASNVTAARLMIAAAVGALLSSAPIDTPRAQNHPENDPKNCREHWEAIGLPTQKAAGTMQIITVCHLGYIVGHNSQTKAPEWVIERLTPALTKGSATRENQSFHED